MKTTQKYLQKYTDELRVKHYPDMPRVAVSISELEPRYGGKAFSHFIILAPWMLADKEQAKSTVRHELAHCIISWLRLPILISHGKEFHNILKQLAPKTWRGDLHWQATEAITEARTRAGIKPGDYKPMKVRLFTCGNPDCLAEPKRLFGWKKIPSYIVRGLFKRCKDCDCPTIVEIGGKHATYRSVH